MSLHGHSCCYCHVGYACRPRREGYKNGKMCSYRKCVGLPHSEDDKCSNSLNFPLAGALSDHHGYWDAPRMSDITCSFFGIRGLRDYVCSWMLPLKSSSFMDFAIESIAFHHVLFEPDAHRSPESHEQMPKEVLNGGYCGNETLPANETLMARLSGLLAVVFHHAFEPFCCPQV